MSDSQGETCGGGTSTGSSSSTSGIVVSEPGTSTSLQHTKMGVEHKLSSSSREMRNMAEKMRRDKLNNYVAEIAGIVPLGSGANKPVDKTSVLRLAANYIRMHKILKEETGSSTKLPRALSKEITHSLAEAVGGFLLVVTSSGKVVYITEAVDQYFGHTQVDLLGHYIYNVIHPDDHEIFQQQLIPKENSRRSFFCRMMEKALSRNDPGRYEIIHVVGQLREIPPVQSPACSVTSPTTLSPTAPSPCETNTSSDHDDDESSDNEGEMQPLKMTNKTGTHMLVSFVRVVKDRPITELSLVESTQEEYITRHGMDGKILYTDHRISFVTGLMPSEVVGTSAFYYMHQDDLVWSIVAQKLMFTSTQGQGTVSYRLRCKDGAHITLRSRGFLEVNKQTGQVESFVCINTVLSVKEAAAEIRNQRRRLLPIIACHETEDHLGSITSSLPPELMVVLKQMMNPEMMQKMIASVKSNEMSLKAENSANVKDLSIDAGFSSSATPENTTDIIKNTTDIKNTDQCHIGHAFQTKPKTPCTDVSYESVPESYVRSISVDEDQGHRMAKKRSSVEDYSTVANKKFGFEGDLPCSGLLHPNYNSSTYSQQLSPRTSPQPHLSPSTSSVPENTGIKNYPPGICQQYSSGSSSSGGCSSYSGTIHPNTNASFPGSYWQTRTPLTLPNSEHCDQSTSFSENSDQRLKQNQPFVGYSPITTTYLPATVSYDLNKGDGLLSPDLCELKITECVNPHDNYNQGISRALHSPDSSHSRSGTVPTSSNLIENRCELVPSPGNYNHGTGSYNQSTNRSIHSPASYTQTVCPGLPSGGSYSQSERKPNPSPQNCDQSVSINISSGNVHSQCSYQYNVASPKSQSTLLENQLVPQYQQTLSYTSHTTNQPQYHHSFSLLEQSLALSPQTSISTCPGSSSEFPPHLQKHHHHHHTRLPNEPESGHHAVLITSSFGEAGTSGVPAVPEPTIPEQCLTRDDPLSKDTGNVFSNGHFQQYSSHNQHGGKLL